MQTANIIKLAVILASAGILSLYFLTKSSITMQSIKELKAGEAAKVEGIVKSLYKNKDGHVFFKLENEGIIQVVAFKNYAIKEASQLENGQKIEITGIVQEYKGKLEIIAKEIKIL